MSAPLRNYKPFWHLGYEAREDHRVPKKDVPKDLTRTQRNFWLLGWEEHERQFPRRAKE